MACSPFEAVRWRSVDITQLTASFAPVGANMTMRDIRQHYPPDNCRLGHLAVPSSNMRVPFAHMNNVNKLPSRQAYGWLLPWLADVLQLFDEPYAVVN